MLFQHGTAAAVLNAQVTQHMQEFVAKGPQYTQGFLDAHSPIGKAWANISLDARYLGAVQAAKAFEFAAAVKNDFAAA